jgi:hypothetical protein
MATNEVSESERRRVATLRRSLDKEYERLERNPLPEVREAPILVQIARALKISQAKSDSK